MEETSLVSARPVQHDNGEVVPPWGVQRHQRWFFVNCFVFALELIGILLFALSPPMTGRDTPVAGLIQYGAILMVQLALLWLYFTNEHLNPLLVLGFHGTGVLLNTILLAYLIWLRGHSLYLIVTALCCLLPSYTATVYGVSLSRSMLVTSSHYEPTSSPSKGTGKQTARIEGAEEGLLSQIVRAQQPEVPFSDGVEDQCLHGPSLLLVDENVIGQESPGGFSRADTYDFTRGETACASSSRTCFGRDKDLIASAGGGPSTGEHFERTTNMANPEDHKSRQEVVSEMRNYCRALVSVTGETEPFPGGALNPQNWVRSSRLQDYSEQNNDPRGNVGETLQFHQRNRRWGGWVSDFYTTLGVMIAVVDILAIVFGIVGLRLVRDSGPPGIALPVIYDIILPFPDLILLMVLTRALINGMPDRTLITMIACFIVATGIWCLPTIFFLLATWGYRIPSSPVREGILMVGIPLICILITGLHILTATALAVELRLRRESRLRL